MGNVDKDEKGFSMKLWYFHFIDFLTEWWGVVELLVDSCSIEDYSQDDE